MSKRQEVTNAGTDMEKREPLCTAVETVNCYSQYGKQYQHSDRSDSWDFHSEEEDRKL